MTGTDIGFPGLGIMLQDVPKGIDFFGFYIAFYGIIIAIGMILGYMMVEWQAKRTNQKADLYLDFAIIAIPCCIIGARLYYVIFSWEQYKNNLLEIFNTRNGGMAIYGAVIVGFVTAVIYSKVRKVNFGLMIDTACVGLLTGQIIGRWGNFFNAEAFGGYAGSSVLAMQLPWETARKHMSATAALELEQYVTEGTILVHPTFLYESLWNLGVLIIILVYTKRKKFDGELGLLYLAGYGLGRFWVESLRTDQLLLWGTDIPVSMLLAAALFVVSIGLIIAGRVLIKKKNK